MNNTGGVAVTWQQTEAIPNRSNAPVARNHGNFQFMQYNNGLQNQSSQPMQSTQPLHPMNWQQTQLSQVQLQQRMIQMQMQQQRKYYDMALESHHTQLQQLRHVHMLKSLFMHNINHPIPSYEARSIIDIKPIAWSMNKPHLPGLPYPPTFLETFQQLPPVYQLALSRVAVFKFITRKATSEEYDKGLECTPDAAFFLQSLRKSSPRFRFPNMVLGFRCQCCLEYRDAVYVKGSTSFVDMGLGPQDTGIRDALKVRIRHFVACPYVSDEDKSLFASFLQVTNPLEKKTQEIFVTQWTQALLASHFPSTFPTSLLAISPDAVPWHGGDVSSFADTIVSSDLFDALSFTAQLIRDGIVFCDMCETMQEGGCPPSLLTELISDHSVLRVTVAHETLRPEATLHYANCACEGHGHLSLPSLVSKGPLRTTLPIDVRDFVLSHAQSCPSIPYYNKQILKRLGDSVDDSFWYNFCMWWQTYLCKLLRGLRSPKIPQSASDYDYFRYITLSDRKKQLYKFLPLLTLPNPDPPNAPTMEETQLNYIFLHNDRYQDFVGNRWFRCQISKHRPLYLQASESVQEVMKKSILSFISKSGYSFVLVSVEGNFVSAPSDVVEKYVTNSLLNGFPEVIRPSVASNGHSKVFDVDFAPRIGVIHESVRWSEGQNSDGKFTLPLLRKDKAEATSLSWRDVWPTSPQGLLQAIRTVNGNDGDQNLAITPIDSAPAASNTTPELASQADDTTPAATNRPTSVVQTNMNESTGMRIPQHVTTLRDFNLEQLSRNKSAISPRRIQDSSNPNSAKKPRTS